MVLRESSLAPVMTDYNNEQCEKIVKGILGYHKEQGAWLGLARFSGHMTCSGQLIWIQGSQVKVLQTVD